MTTHEEKTGFRRRQSRERGGAAERAPRDNRKGKGRNRC